LPTSSSVTAKSRHSAMPVHNVNIAAIFEEMAGLLETEEPNPFRDEFR